MKMFFEINKKGKWKKADPKNDEEKIESLEKEIKLVSDSHERYKKLYEEAHERIAKLLQPELDAALIKKNAWFKKQPKILMEIGLDDGSTHIFSGVELSYDEEDFYNTEGKVLITRVKSYIKASFYEYNEGEIVFTGHRETIGTFKKEKVIYHQILEKV